MRVDVLEYYSETSWKMMKAEASAHETPCLIVDLNNKLVQFFHVKFN